MIGRRSIWTFAALALALPACKSRTPEERVAPAADAGARGLDKKEIRDVVESHHAELRRDCLADAGAEEQWMVHVFIDEDGGVAHVIVEGGDRAIAKCFEEHVARWTFPGGPATFDLPMHAKHEGK